QLIGRHIWTPVQLSPERSSCHSGSCTRRNDMAQTIWIHKVADAKKADGMDYVCHHLFETLTDHGSLAKANGRNAVPTASAKEGATYRSLFCDTCAKNYKEGSIRIAKEAVLV